jgi:acyl-CoA synthetase (AMP-forming)/AMP-acid ligase II
VSVYCWETIYRYHPVYYFLGHGLPPPQVDQAAAGLLALGLKRGDRLGVWGPNTYHWILFQFATAKAGIILVKMRYYIRF